MQVAESGSVVQLEPQFQLEPRSPRRAVVQIALGWTMALGAMAASAGSFARGMNNAFGGCDDDCDLKSAPWIALGMMAIVIPIAIAFAIGGHVRLHRLKRRLLEFHEAVLRW